MKARGRSGSNGRAAGAIPVSTLTPTQERFLAGFFSEGENPFYLSGGTALSGFYLGHRASDDLDFFTRDRESLRGADRYVEAGARAAALAIERKLPRGDLVQYFLSGDTDPAHPLLKIELLFDTEPYFAEPRSFDGVRVDDLLSIAVNKITTILRFEPKDYFDIYMIVKSGRHRLEDLIPLAKEKLVGLDEVTIGAHFRQALALPNLVEYQRAYMLVPVDLSDLLRFFAEWAERLFAVLPPRAE